MKQKKIMALLLALVLLLSGCAQLETLASQLVEKRDAQLRQLADLGRNKESFSQMTYTRPDMEAFQALQEESCQLGKTSKDVEKILDQTTALYEAYDRFYTMLNLADIYYCLDLSNADCQAEYAYCMSQSALVDQALEEYYRALAQGPAVKELEEYFGEGFFENYTGESVWDEEFVAMWNREREIVSQYYAAMNELGDASYEKRAQTLGPMFVDLIAQRQELAAWVGYDDCEEFLWDWSYNREYFPEDLDGYLQEIQQELVPLFEAVQESGLYDQVYRRRYGEQQCLAYLSSAANAMGGGIQEAYEEMTGRAMYDIAPSAQKYEGSFEIYLTSYDAPFVFLNPYEDISDFLSFAHEFGHFTNDYLTGGSYVTTDVAELMSQGMEYMSLCYATEPSAQVLDTARQLKMADSLGVYVGQAAYYSFERQAYQLTGDDLTVENLNAIYSQVAQDFGFDSVGWDEAGWTEITHFFTNPFYVISYVVSNDGAMQLYQMEQEEAGAGLELFLELLETEEDIPLLTLLESKELESPFERVRQVAETFREEFDLVTGGAGR